MQDALNTLVPATSQSDVQYQIASTSGSVATPLAMPILSATQSAVQDAIPSTSQYVTAPRTMPTSSAPYTDVQHAITSDSAHVATAQANQVCYTETSPAHQYTTTMYIVQNAIM